MKYLVIKLSTLLLLLCSSCNETNDIEKEVNVLKVQYKIYTSEVLDEIRDDIWNRVRLNYFDKNNNIIDGLDDSRDTFYLQVNYNSLKYPIINNNHVIDVYSLSDNCSFSRINDNKFRLIVDSQFARDTIEYKIYLKSANVLFLNLNSDSTRIDQSNHMKLGTFYETVGKL